MAVGGLIKINIISASNCVIIIICSISTIYGGLLTGDLKLRSTPFTINHHAPLVINIDGRNKPPFPPLSLPKPEKPPPLIDQLFSPSRTLLKAVSPLGIPKVLSLLPPVVPPLLPKLPILPLLPLPPIIPPIPLLPFLPPPLIPKLPRTSLLRSSLDPLSLRNPLKPLKVPILGKKTPVEKALSKVTKKISSLKKTKSVSDKLKDLLNKGSLTSREFNRFKRLLTK
ncbi:hypothetical protein evm_001370 [Chilo suppressalis]|nr:hypothetical protein evm_001370 [Chilo suppressalis]